ncbi:S26 family signal peptidase [Streptomyces sp. AGS-58]|uniref:S26 family signal peptidase n=1 Tax=unclassified Streptomyces TaxID=2593676 RepID=UPI0035A26FCC
MVCCTVVAGKERIAVDGRPMQEPYVYGGDADGLHRSYDVRVPRGRLILRGDHRSDSMDSRFFASDRYGTLPVAAVRGRVTGGQALLSLLGAAVVLVVTGAGLGIGALAVRRRRAPAVPPVPWPVRPV